MINEIIIFYQNLRSNNVVDNSSDKDDRYGINSRFGDIPVLLRHYFTG
jgi:hypothetical protein